MSKNPDIKNIFFLFCIHIISHFLPFERSSVGQDGFTNFFLEISNHLGGKKSEIIEANEGLKSIELAAAIYKAARTEKKVFLPINKNSLIYNSWNPNKN